MPKPTKEELVSMVRTVQTASACIADLDSMLNQLEAKIGDPNVGQLIFEPHDGKILNAEEVVEVSLARTKSTSKPSNQ